MLAAIRKQFFEVIKTVISKIKEERSTDHVKSLLSALMWDFRGVDFDYLAKFDIFDMLHNGDGTRSHPLRAAWGRQLRQARASQDDTLARAVLTLFEFLYKQILSQITQVDAQNDDQAKSKKP